MKTNLFKRTLSLAIVACMLIAMVAVAPMASAAVSPLTFGMDVFEYDNKGVTEVRVAVYMTGYENWDLEVAGIDNIQFNVNFDNSKLTFVGSLAGSGAQKAFTAPTGMTVTASGTTTAAAANANGYVVYLADAGVGEDEETGDPLALYIPQGEKVYFRTYRFTIKEGAEGACEFALDTTKLYITDYFNNVTKIVNGNMPSDWTANNGVYTLTSAAPEYTISYNANGGVGTMENTVGTAPVVAANAFTKAGYTFAGWVDAQGNAVEVGATVEADTVLTATWTANNTNEVASWYKMIGAQARTAESGKAAGMRFGVDLKGLVEGVVVEEKGIIMMPTDLLNGELTHNTANVAEGKFDATKYYEENGAEIYTAVLVNIPAGQEARPITVRGYVKVNGNYYYTSAMERNYADVLAKLEAMQ